MSRVLLVPVVMVLTRSSDRLDWAMAAAGGLFVLAALTDLADGYLARRWEQTSVLGAFLDTTADKLLVTGALFALVSIERVSIWAAVIIVMREFVVMALRSLVALDGGMVRPSTWGKIKATAQFVAISLAFFRLGPELGPLYLDQWAMWVAVILTIGSGWSYVASFWSHVQSSRSSARA